ncbi:hypothetical protein ACVGVM_08070 [Pseudonocardia bannensis]|uniref:Uncharacterized protein n=1 Tax=Pseudonocardia bannensis TaxID=630973 RepID=A0A848DCS3_9PSEU|nr:hypothetical protein [Pseudonocardia bannensis]NMH90409.1 hypothetical protein [Pseudonocardia bannensis]
MGIALDTSDPVEKRDAEMPVSGDAPAGPPEAPGPGRRDAVPAPDVDRAALLGAALAAVVALSFGSAGEWDWLATAVGLALLTVITVFFRLDGRAAPVRRAELAAFAAVAALCATLVVAAPVQSALQWFTPVGRTCAAAGAVADAVALDTGRERLAAAVAAGRFRPGDPAVPDDGTLRTAAAETGRTAEAECLGAATSRWLWVPAVILAAGVFLMTDRRAARRR